MQAVASSLLFGLVCAGVGLIAEWQRIPGFRGQTGYLHLGFLSSFFYALGDPKSVLITVFVLNSLIGTLISLPFTILIEAIGKRRGNSGD
jgi:hypothetical protein